MGGIVCTSPKANLVITDGFIGSHLIYGRQQFNLSRGTDVQLTEAILVAQL